jgi:hypothetical protein
MTVVLARIAICDQVQLADLMKVQFTSYFRGAANTSHTNTDALPDVCHKLAQQRALLHGAAVGSIMKFNIAPGTAYSSAGTLTFPVLEDSTQSNKTTLPIEVLHELNEDGGTITLSTTPNANTSIIDDEGNSVKYFTDFSKYFLTRSRANGEFVTTDENTAPYGTPTGSVPFIPPNTINGESFTGTVDEPTANSDVRYEYTLVANTDAIAGGHIGGGYDLAEDLYTGNTYVWMEVSNVSGSFSASETLTDFANNTSTIKSVANTSTVLLETFDTVGTFVAGELLTDRGTNATVFSTQTAGNEVNITLTGSTFDTGSSTDITLGFPTSNTITLDTNSISRTGSTVIVQTTDEHGILSGERIVLKGADDIHDEFNGIFEVGDTTANTLTFTTTNSGSVNPTGNFSMVKNVVFGRTSNAAGAIRTRTVNATANIVFQSANLDVGFTIANTISGGTSGATGVIDSRTTQGEWYQTKTKEVKVFNSGTGEWTIDAAANTGEFWNKYSEPVRISTIIPTSGTGSSTVAAKLVATKAIATSGDTSGGYDSTIITKLPGTYFAYPLKTWADQTHDGIVTLEAYGNFANVIVAPEGLDVNYDWLPLSRNAAGNILGADISQNGAVGNTANHSPEEATSLSKAEFVSKLGPYTTALASPADDVYRSVNPNTRSTAIKVGVVYPYANANPFFPATGGTHKPIANTADGITGTQPGGLDANSIYAGAYSEYQKGALEPAGDFRFAIQNDQKWIYASSSGISYNAPNVANQKDIMFAGTATATAVNNSATEIADNSGTSNASVVVTIPADSPVVCTTTTHANNGNTGQLYTTGTAGGRANMILRDSQGCILSGYSCIGGTGGANEGACTSGGGSWTPSAGSPTSSVAEFPCFFNRVQYVMTSAGAALTVGQANTAMEPNFRIFYQLLLDLTSAAYGKNYTDPVQRTEAGSYSEVGRSDASFRTMVETMKSRVDTTIGLHNTERTAVISAMAGSNAYSHPSGYKTAYDSMISYLGTFRDGIKNRITEITNRIGCLNGKNTAVGGNTAMQVTVGAAGAGFTGYPFNGGTGYANTVYAHANFLAGKKINLLGKILSAISDVDQVYGQITANRAEYYEYNQ